MIQLNVKIIFDKGERQHTTPRRKQHHPQEGTRKQYHPRGESSTTPDKDRNVTLLEAAPPTKREEETQHHPKGRKRTTSLLIFSVLHIN